MSSVKPPAQSFEFTKRKRWAETLFSEISETLILIVSPSFKVLYCGAAIVELLGWKEDQLVDADLSAIINNEDLQNFLWAFTESLQSGKELFTYARFKYEQSPSESPCSLLFEVKGHPHYLPGDPPSQCFFLSAMPYPTRDIALLNSFLQLKIENERLTHHIRALKQASEASEHQSMATHSQPFGQASDVSTTSDINAHHAFYGQVNSTSMTIQDNIAALSGSANTLGTGSGESFEEQSRKKFKKTCLGEDQRVCMTCGRTDSPEWRKGPHGPKTLCNACGLRWAKRSRRPENDVVMPVNPNQDITDPETEASSSSFQNMATHMTF